MSKTRLLAVQVLADTTVADVKAQIDEALSTRQWLILVFHQIENNGEQYSTTPQNLTQIANYITQKNIKTVTASQGVALMAQ